jgi:hypothetical protein
MDYPNIIGVDDEVTYLSQNGMAEEKLPRLDRERKVFITSDRVEVPLTGARINPLIIQMIQNQGRPEIPKVEVMLAGKHRQLEDNPTDENYLKAVADWKERSSINTGKYLFNIGIKGQPLEGWLAENAEYIEEATASDLKYMWVASLVTDGDDLTELINVIMGYALPTVKGMSEAANFTK